MPLSRAEIQRRYRERRAAAADPVRVFLTAIIDDAEKARANGAATPTGQRLAAIAADTLARFDRVPESESKLAEFARRNGISGAFTRVAGDLRHEQAVETLTWANQERVVDRATPAVIREGLRAAKVLVSSTRRLNTSAIDYYLSVALAGGEQRLAPPELIGDDAFDSAEDADLLGAI
jgi:hypothetical protein